MVNWQNRLEELCLNRESVEVEFKSGKGGFPGSFWETFSAFANTDGGIIVVGVREKEGKFIPDGLSADRVQEYTKRFWDAAHNKSCVSVPLLLESDIEVAVCADGVSCVLIFHIPRAPYNLRPVYLTQNPINNTYKRNHEGDYRCTEYQVRRMFADADHVLHPADSGILPNFTLDDLDELTLRQYRQRFKLNFEDHAWNTLSDLEFLKRIGAYRVDRAESGEGLTVAGLLMFGKYESITEPACCPWYFVDYREYLGNDTQERWSNRVYPDGNWAANLFQFFYRVYPLVTQALPVPFRLEGAIRVDDTTAHKAVREAMINMMIHADYFGRDGLVIERRKHELKFKNPGTMLISVSEFFEGGRSICRNPSLQKMFMYLGGGERAGSGADTILRGWTDNCWCRPSIVENHANDLVCLTLQTESLYAMAHAENECRRAGITPQEKGATPQEKGATHQVKGATPQEKGATPQEKGKSTPQEKGVTPQEKGVTPQEKGVTPQVKGATPQEKGATPQEKGVTPQVKGATPQEKGATPQVKGATPQEKGKSTPQEKGATPQVKGATPQEKGATPQEKGATPQEKGKSTPQEKGGTPQVKGVTPQEKGATPQEKGAIPQEKGATPQEKGKVIDTTISKQNGIEKLIIDFCVEAKNTAEIAEFLGIKDKKFVRKKYLAPLIGVLLELTHPDVPRHRNQKYRTKKL